MLSRIGKEKLPLLVALVFIAIVLLKRGRQERTYELFIPGHEPEQVWDLLADFRNVARLNLRIRQWELGKESTSKNGDWRYKVTSHESMVADWLFGLNVNHGEVVVKAVNPPLLYTISSDFTTESFRGMLIIHNTSEVSMERVTRDGEVGTLYKERVVMDCPLLFGPLCSGETDANRKDFLTHLGGYFT